MKQGTFLCFYYFSFCIFLTDGTTLVIGYFCMFNPFRPFYKKYITKLTFFIMFLRKYFSRLQNENFLKFNIAKNNYVRRWKHLKEQYRNDRNRLSIGHGIGVLVSDEPRDWKLVAHLCSSNGNITLSSDSMPCWSLQYSPFKLW